MDTILVNLFAVTIGLSALGSAVLVNAWPRRRRRPGLSWPQQ